jgi:hypothetical protein
MKDYFKVHPKIRQALNHNIISYLKFHKTLISNSPTANSIKYYIKSRNTGITKISLNDQKTESKNRNTDHSNKKRESTHTMHETLRRTK